MQALVACDSLQFSETRAGGRSTDSGSWNFHPRPRPDTASLAGATRRLLLIEFRSIVKIQAPPLMAVKSETSPQKNATIILSFLKSGVAAASSGCVTRIELG